MNGLHLVFLVIVGAALLATFYRASHARPASAIVTFILWFVLSGALGSFFAGAGLLAFKTHRYLNDGQWPRIDNRMVLEWLGTSGPTAPTGWVLDILSWDAVVTLMALLPLSLWVPFTAGVVAILLVATARGRRRATA